MSTQPASQAVDPSGSKHPLTLVRALFRRNRDRASEEDHEHITHLTRARIVQKLGMGPGEYALLWLSKTDIYALAHCTHHTRLTLSALGLMVLFTSALALISGYMTLSLVIDPKLELKGVLGLAGAALYAFGIMLIDREIVGNPSHKTIWIRLVFAVVIATAVSYPIKLKLLDGPIRHEIGTMVEERNAEKVQRIKELENRGLKARDAQLGAKDQQLAGIRKIMRELEAQIYDERTKKELGAMCDRRCEAAKAQLLAYQGRESVVIAEMEKLRGDDGLPANAQDEVKRLRAEIRKEQEDATDFLSYWQAQDRVLTRDQSGARVLNYFLFFFFLALELVPVALKYALGTSEYHQYLEARYRLNMQKLASMTNMLLEIVRDAKSPADILSLPPELTDLLTYLMEDGTMPMDLSQHFLDIFSAGVSSEAVDRAPGDGQPSGGSGLRAGAAPPPGAGGGNTSAQA